MLERRHLGPHGLHHIALVEILAAVSLAVDREENLRRDLRKRSTTLRAPKSGEALDQTAPMLETARNAMTASAMFGRYATTRSPPSTPRPRRPVATRAVWSRSSPHVISDS